MRTVVINHSLVNLHEIKPWSTEFLKMINSNLGNAVISHSILKILPGVEIHPAAYNLGEVHNSKSLANDINSKYGKCILVLQDHVVFESMPPSVSLTPKHILAVADFLKNIAIPTFVVSLTVRKSFELKNQADFLTPETLELLNSLRNPLISVGVRGKFTERLLRDFGGIKVKAVGCPSFFARVSDKTANPVPDILGTNGRLTNSEAATIHIAQGDDSGEPLLIPYLSADGKIYSTKQIENKISDYYKPKFLEKIYFPASVEDWIRVTGKVTLIAGTRLHGAIVALNAGLPVLTVATDMRAKETLDFMDIPYFEELTDELIDYSEKNTKNLFEEYDNKYPKRLDYFRKWLN